MMPCRRAQPSSTASGTTPVKNSEGVSDQFANPFVFCPYCDGSPSNQTEVPKRLFDDLALLGRARYDAPATTGAVRRSARRQAPKRLDMSDPTRLRDEAVMPLNEVLYLAVGRHSLLL